MKKALLTSSLALALGTTSVATAGQAYAAESVNTQKEEVDFVQLAELAKAESKSLNEKPVHVGAYNYEFSKDGFSYEFKSDGISWTWNYKYTGAADTVVNKTVEVAPVAAPTTEAKAPAAVVSAPVVKEAPKAVAPAQPVAKPAVQQTSYKAPVAKPAAVKTYKAPVQQTAAPVNTGGVNWSALAQCESGGRANVVDPSGSYHGLYQFDVQTWHSVGGSGVPSQASAAEQTKRAQILYNQRGSQPWPVCGARL
ncbi:transglycosylase family protein [Macrococcus animalis]|uniref:transglycosylase family protein n=1 Tax=Macrococcus animalis TaxID=3395467 RepID=UPI0039BDE144